MSGELPALAGGPASQITQLAARSATAIYQTASMASSFLTNTGGAASTSLDRAFTELASYYVLALSGSASEREFDVKLRRPGLQLRVRRQRMGHPVGLLFTAPRLPEDLTEEALNSPFLATEISIHLSVLYFYEAKNGPYAQVLCSVDPRELSWLRDGKGIRHAEAELHIAGILQPGQQSLGISRTHRVDATDEQYQQLLAKGLVLTFTLNGLTPGPRLFHAVLSETRSNRMGSASTFLDAPNLAGGGLALSGILLQAAEASNRGSVAMRAFRPGDTLEFAYSIYNVFAAPDGRSEVQSQIRLYGGGGEVFTGTLNKIAFTAGSDSTRRGINGKVKLDSKLEPGRYIMHVTVTDLLRPQPQVTAQWVDFTLEN